VLKKTNSQTHKTKDVADFFLHHFNRHRPKLEQYGSSISVQPCSSRDNINTVAWCGAMCCMPVFRGRHTRFTSEAARTTVVRHSSSVSARRNPSVHRRARVSVARFQNARTACPCPRTVCVSRSPRAAHRCNRQISIFRDAVARRARAVGC